MKAEKVKDYGIDGKYTVFLLMKDGKPTWYKVPNEVAENLPDFINVKDIAKYICENK